MPKPYALERCRRRRETLRALSGVKRHQPGYTRSPHVRNPPQATKGQSSAESLVQEASLYLENLFYDTDDLQYLKYLSFQQLVSRTASRDYFSAHTLLLKDFSNYAATKRQQDLYLSIQANDASVDTINLFRVLEPMSELKTLRQILSVRIKYITDPWILRRKYRGQPIPNTWTSASILNTANAKHLKPIPASILDVPLSPLHFGGLERLLPMANDIQSTAIYRGLNITTCFTCQKQKIEILERDVCVLFRDLGEFPLVDPNSRSIASCGTICSDCLLKSFVTGMVECWWRDLDQKHWVKQGQCTYGSRVDYVADKGIDWYLAHFHTLRKDQKENISTLYHQVSSYRTALQRLTPRPRRQQMELATKLWTHCVKTGVMQGCIDAPIAEGIAVWGRLDTPVGQNPDSDNCMFPTFPSLFKRIPTSKECIVCAEDKFEVNYGTWEEWTRLHSEFPGPWTWEILEFPIGEHQRCSHPLDVCRECVATHIGTCVNDGNLTRIACPQCDRIFAYEEIEKLSRRELFEKYDKLLLRNVVSKLPNFRWCLNPACDSGQVYDNIDLTLACIQCSACDFRMCFRHEQPWHVGLTCIEFTSALAGDPKYEETQKIIKASTKACPQCAIRIEKGNGCFHMTCSKCKHEFCWECLASWKAVRSDKSKHAEDCYFRNSTHSPTGISGADLATALRRNRLT